MEPRPARLVGHRLGLLALNALVFALFRFVLIFWLAPPSAGGDRLIRENRIFLCMP